MIIGTRRTGRTDGRRCVIYVAAKLNYEKIWCSPKRNSAGKLKLAVPEGHFKVPKLIAYPFLYTATGDNLTFYHLYLKLGSGVLSN